MFAVVSAAGLMGLLAIIWKVIRAVCMNLSINPNTSTKSDPAEPQARFLRACARLPVDRTPVWFMRQAGRYMPEYREIRSKYDLLEIVKRPEIAAEVTLQPVRAFGVDAAILFADILLPVVPMGMKLAFLKGEGPQLSEPIRSSETVQKLRVLKADEDLGHVMETVRLVRRELDEHTPLIGFSGAPFTVASYMIEGGPSREYRFTKSLMYSSPDVWHSLMVKLAVSLSDYLLAQIRAGAQAVQLFDSWVGSLSPMDYQRFVLPYTRQVFDSVRSSGVPAIHFGTGTSTLLKLMQQAGGDVIGMDWRIPLDQGWRLLGHANAVQGNLDPVALFSPMPVLREQVQDVLRRARSRAGHIFNLGHGILQHTPVENVRAVVEMVHEWTG
jgi:uroporphyrinogen decarboxylase